MEGCLGHLGKRSRKLLGIATLTLLPATLAATPGDLDRGFGTGGLVTTDLANQLGIIDPTADKDVINAIALQSDGKIVAVGYYTVGADNATDFAIARYNIDGTLDTDFGDRGITLTDFGAPNDKAFAVSILPDQRIVVGGTSGGDFAIARYDTSGDPDLTFDTDGKKTINMGAADDTIRSIFATNWTSSTSWIYAAGHSNNNFALLRIRLNGSELDGFGSGGRVFTDFGSTDIAYAMSLEGTRILLAGKSGNNFALAKYLLNNGAPDNSFDGDGKLTTDLGGTDHAYAMTQLGTSIFAAGRAGGDFAIVKYRYSDGAPDSAFGTAGIVRTDFAGGTDHAYGVGIQQGKLIVAGRVGADFGIARYDLTSGDPDQTFGVQGKVFTDVGGIEDIATSLVIQADGKIVVAGKKGITGDTGTFALVRYESFAADPSITLTVDRPEIFVGENLTLTYRVQNSGPDPANDVSFETSFPNATLVSTTPSRGTCDVSETDVECDFGTMRVGEAVTVDFTLSFASSGNFEVTADLSTSSPDSNLPNNQARISFTVSEIPPLCGNGAIDPGEGCDDGNLVSGDGCSAGCRDEDVPPVCGDNACNGSEICSTCNEDCGACPPECGNNVEETGEACDDGNTEDGDGCSATCEVEEEESPPDPFCGDGSCDESEDCDSCSVDCFCEIVCGDGFRDVGEACDDGNLTPGDGCSDVCEVEEEQGEDQRDLNPDLNRDRSERTIEIPSPKAGGGGGCSLIK